MRAFSIPLPTVLSGFVAVLVGYASSAAIIWQAALAAGATTGQIAGWMTALGLAMGGQYAGADIVVSRSCTYRMVNARCRAAGDGPARGIYSGCHRCFYRG